MYFYSVLYLYTIIAGCSIENSLMIIKICRWLAGGQRNAAYFPGLAEPSAHFSVQVEAAIGYSKAKASTVTLLMIRVSL